VGGNLPGEILVAQLPGQDPDSRPETLSGALESGVPLPNDVGKKRSSDQPQTLHTFL